MDANEARILLGFPPNSNPSPSQVKSAYKQKVWESHPDLFPSHEKPLAESKFKLISEAYTCLLPGGRGEASTSAEYWRVVRTGVPRANGGRKNHAMIKVPFLLLILGTVALGGFNASRDTLSTTATQGLQKAEGGLPFTQSISSLMTSRAGIMPGTAYTPFAIDG